MARAKAINPWNGFEITHLKLQRYHYNGVIMSAVVFQITSFSIVCSTVGSGADHRKHQSFVSLAFVQGIHRWPVNSPHKRPVTWKMFPFDDVIMISGMPMSLGFLWVITPIVSVGCNYSTIYPLKSYTKYLYPYCERYVFYCRRETYNIGYPSETHLELKHRPSITSDSVAQSFRNCAYCTTASLPQSVQNFETIDQLQK